MYFGTHSGCPLLEYQGHSIQKKGNQSLQFIYQQHLHMSWSKQDQLDAHLPHIVIFGLGPFSNQISSDTLFTYTQLVLYLHGL